LVLLTQKLGLGGSMYIVQLCFSVLYKNFDHKTTAGLWAQNVKIEEMNKTACRKTKRFD